ncbi:hypothetical protein [Microbacterium sp.]|uniref:hypothetical protein n=1 Tax=Microbacterium sp. TaxID=51671 RepID=UPI0027370E04|nr:hypothetical protein [Microbacterium sp.]MDP3950584.1 hypothetical protein [Microbacterium sp.]
MQLKMLMKDLVDAVDGAGREFKTGFAGAFRKRGGRHRADADAIRNLDRRGGNSVPKHRKEPATSHAKKYHVLEDVSRGIESHGHVPRHSNPDYNLVQDLGRSVGKTVRDIPGDIVDEVKGVPKTIPKQLVEELYEDAIGQDDPDKYGQTSGDMRFLAPASESRDLTALSQGELEVRFGLEPGALEGASIAVKPVPDSRFVSVDIDYPGRD